VPLKNKIVDESELQPVNGDELSRIRQLAGIRVDEVKSGMFNSKMIGQRVKIVSQEDSFGNNHLGEEGVITRASREHTFSQMVPFIIEYGVQLDSGKKITIRRESIRKLKETRDSTMYNRKEEWLAVAQERGYEVEEGGDNKLYAHVDGHERGYWDPRYGGFGTGIFHGLKETADNHQKKIAIDTVRNPDKSLLGGPSAKEAEDTLRRKFGYTDKQIAKLKETASGGATGAGAIASAPTAMGGVQSRNASIYGQTTLRKKPTPKKRPTKEDTSGDGIGRSKKE